MKLKMTGQNTTSVRYVTAQELKKVSSGNSKGYFDTDIEWNDKEDPITVTFKNTIYINEALDKKLKKDVEAHERRHFSDFKVLAAKLKADIDKALNERRDPQIGDRIDWLIYDRCQKSAAFHRQGDGYSVEICDRPSSSRPN